MLKLSDKELKKIIARRDPKYDGRFYFGVKTTKIYCRPVCPARPKPENIIICRSHSEAEMHGFRPCKRCRPDMNPAQKSHDEKYLIVTRALDIFETSDDISNMDDLAASLDITSRHLRRLFSEYLGASPIDVLNSKRLHLAKKFLTETNRSITEIAYSVGFNSLRRFNEAFKKLYHDTPSSMRKTKSIKKSSSPEVILELLVRPPFDWKYTLEYLKRHLIYGAEVIEGDQYIRFIPTDEGRVGKIKAKYDEKKGRILLQCFDLSLNEIKSSLPKLRKLFDTDHNPAHLPTRKKRERAIRVLTCFDSYEVAISIILSQLVSTAQAKKKLEDLIIKYGEKLTDEEIYLFPTPEVLAKAEVETIGLTKVKGHAIRELSQKISKGEIELAYLKNISETKKELLKIKGIGPWTVELIAMRCLGDVNSFPSSDLIIRRAVEQKLIDEDKWQGVRSYLCHLAWRDLAKELTK